MRDQILSATKDAMKAGDKRRLTTLRLISAAIKDRDIAARVDEKGVATGNDAIADDEILQLLQKMVKQRRESVVTYKEADRQDLVDQELAEIGIIEEFLPAQMSEDEIAAAVDAAIGSTGASGPKDIGRVMGHLKAKHAGQMDFGKASAAVRARLNA